MPQHRPLWYRSPDDLQLHAREYAHDNSPFTLLCMHGLTRNAADFEEFCDTFASDYHILAVDQRGRGNSDYDPSPERYQLPHYASDMLALLEHRQVEDVVLVGTSMGGLIAMQMLAMQPDKIRGIVLNDIGAVVEAEGLARIQQYAGKDTTPARDWAEAIAQARETNSPAFPDYNDSDWERFARKLYRENNDGRPVRAYDPAITAAAAEAGPAEPMDLWPLFDNAAPVPKLVVRGALSDILSRECVLEMQRRMPELENVELENRGHAPMLDEPEAVEAIRRFFRRL